MFNVHRCQVFLVSLIIFWLSLCYELDSVLLWRIQSWRKCGKILVMWILLLKVGRIRYCLYFVVICESRSDKILSLFCCNLWKLGTELWSLSGRLIGDAFVLSCFWGLEYSRNRPSNFIITKKDKVVIHRLPASRLQLAVTQLNHQIHW